MDGSSKHHSSAEAPRSSCAEPKVESRQPLLPHGPCGLAGGRGEASHRVGGAPDDVVDLAKEADPRDDVLGHAMGDGAVHDERVVDVDEERHLLCMATASTSAPG